jgi:hypothetical protein
VSSNPTQPRSAYKISSEKLPGSTPAVTINLPLYLYSWPGSVVGTATGYGLGAPGIESRWGARFSAPIQTGPGAHPASCTMGTGSFPGVKSGRGATLPPHPLPLPWSWKSRAIPLLPQWAVQSLSARTTVHFSFYLYISITVTGHVRTARKPTQATSCTSEVPHKRSSLNNALSPTQPILHLMVWWQVNRLGKDMKGVGHFLLQTQCSIYLDGWVKWKYFSTVYSKTRTGHLPNVGLITFSYPHLWPLPANARICGSSVRYSLHVYDKRAFWKPTIWSDKIRTVYKSRALPLETRFSFWKFYNGSTSTLIRYARRHVYARTPSQLTL